MAGHFFIPIFVAIYFINPVAVMIFWYPAVPFASVPEATINKNNDFFDAITMSGLPKCFELFFLYLIPAFHKDFLKSFSSLVSLLFILLIKELLSFLLILSVIFSLIDYLGGIYFKLQHLRCWPATVSSFPLHCYPAYFDTPAPSYTDFAITIEIYHHSYRQ